MERLAAPRAGRPANSRAASISASPGAWPAAPARAARSRAADPGDGRASPPAAAAESRAAAVPASALSLRTSAPPRSGRPAVAPAPARPAPAPRWRRPPPRRLASPRVGVPPTTDLKRPRPTDQGQGDHRQNAERNPLPETPHRARPLLARRPRRCRPASRGPAPAPLLHNPRGPETTEGPRRRDGRAPGGYAGRTSPSPARGASPGVGSSATSSVRAPSSSSA